MFDAASRKDIIAAAKRHGINPAALLAVAQVESSGIPFVIINGRKEPLIRFEGHYFDRILRDRSMAKLTLARSQGLADPKAGRIKNPNSQEARYQMLARAKSIDFDAAIESVSWGLGQVMGANWRELGFSNAGELESTARSGVAGQIELMIRFIRKNGLLRALNDQDWRSFARRYNGPNYAANNYHTNMARAFSDFRSLSIETGARATTPDWTPTIPTMDVREIQVTLKSLGYDPGKIDGDWGSNTSAALRAFQERNGLSATGERDEATLRLLISGGRPMIDPSRAVETEDDLAKKGSTTVKLSRRGRLYGILGMIAGAIGFTGAQGGFDGLGATVQNLANNSSNGDPDTSFLSLMLKLLGTVFGVSGGGMWIVLIGLAFMFYRNARSMAERRVEDHRQGWNTKY